MNRENSARSAAIGFAIAAVGLVAAMAFAWLFRLLRPYGPAAREFLLWMLVPQFGIGMLFMLVVVLLWMVTAAFRETGP